jgi:hypothetical protein
MVSEEKKWLGIILLIGVIIIIIFVALLYWMGWSGAWES